MTVEETPSPAPEELRLFVYGTLKKGFKNHEHYCRGASLVSHGRAWGRLYLVHPNVPTLSVPEPTVLLRGSDDYPRDFAAQQELMENPPPFDWGSYRPGRNWRMIEGELLSFPEPAKALGILDAVEGFHPRTPEFYDRVLVPVQLGSEEHTLGHELVWTYVLPAGEEPPGKPLNANEWSGT